MNINYNTDLQVAQDLQKLSDTITRAVDYANLTLEEAKKVPELKQMISEAHVAKTSIENASSILINTNASIENANNTFIKINTIVDSKSTDLKEIESYVKEIKDLISKFNSLKTQNDRAETLLKQIAPAYSSVQELSNELAGVYTLEKYLQKFKKNHKIKQLFRVLWKDFGVAGIFIYILICTIPKNSTMKSLFR